MTGIEAEIKAFLEQQLESATEFRNAIGKEFLEYRMSNILQQRDFLKHMTLISAAVISVVPIFVDRNLVNQGHLYAGLILHFLVVAIIFAYLLEILKADAAGLREQQRRYTAVMQRKIELLKKYLGIGYHEGFSSQLLAQYNTELQTAPEVALLKDEARVIQDTKQLQDDGFTTFVFALFIDASILILLALLQIQLPTLKLIAYLAGISFFILFLPKIISYLLNRIWNK